MNLIFRLLLVWLGALARPKLQPHEVSRLRMRVWPHDLDVNMHMTNSRYFAMMDLGRLDWILRSGIWRVMRRQRLGAVLGGSMVRYRRALRPFEGFTLATKILGWDERWFYVEQTLHGAEGLACIAVHRAGFMRGGKLVPPGEIAPWRWRAPPAWAAEWGSIEAAFCRHG